jgi:hypothetical protein
VKFRAFQTHTVKDPKGHYISVKGTEARNGPFKFKSKTMWDIMGWTKDGAEVVFAFSTWQIVSVKDKKAVQPTPELGRS